MTRKSLKGVEISLEEIGVKRRIGDSTLGFAKFTMRGKHEDAVNIGSGVLVRVGQVSGVLTASHVVNAIPAKGEIGVLRFPPRPETIQDYRLNVEHLEYLTIGSEPWNSRGPDIAFFRLPLRDVANIEATNSFIDLDATLARLITTPPPSRNSVLEVGGVLDELTIDHRPANPNFLIKKFEGRVHEVKIAKMTKVGNWDRIRATPDTFGDKPFPRSFGGMSGGGLWKIFIGMGEKEKPEIVECRLCGIMYYQTQGSKRTLVCHGEKSIYRVMLARIKRKWREASK